MTLHYLLTIIIPILASLIESIRVIIVYGCIKALYMFVKNGFALKSGGIPYCELRLFD